jgi:hypothetical protein
MQTWSITLYGPSGIISTVDTGESQFVIGTETASDVFSVQGDGIAPRHAWVWISEAGLQVEDLGGGTLVNGYQINERVQVEYPTSVQVGEVTLVVEVKVVQPVAVSPKSSSFSAPRDDTARASCRNEAKSDFLSLQPDPQLEVFNAPTPDFSCEKRESSNVTPQVFSLFNGNRPRNPI